MEFHESTLGDAAREPWKVYDEMSGPYMIAVAIVYSFHTWHWLVFASYVVHVLREK